MLIDARFDNGRGGASSDLHALDVRNGDTLTLSWIDYAAGCRTPAGDPAIAVSVVAYAAEAGAFDPTIDQPLLAGWSSCGAGEAPCEPSSGRYELSVMIPDADVSCTIQSDVVVGLPLAVVGPRGSYYNSVIRNDQRANMLIADTTLTAVPCAAPVQVPPSAAPTATALAIPTAPAPNVPAAAVAATETSQPTQPPVPTTATPSAVPSAVSSAVSSEVPSAVLGATAQRTLAATGWRGGNNSPCSPASSYS